MKKLLVIVLFGIMVLVGCGNNQGDNTQNSGSKLQNSELSSQTTQGNEKNNEQLISVSMAMLKEANANAKEDFEYVEVDGEIIIQEYIGKSTIVVIPDEIEGCPVVKLDAGIFSNNESIQAVKIGNHITYCSSQLFINCTALQYVIFGEKVEVVDNACFVGCIALEEVELNEGLKEIGNGAFGTLGTKLKQLTIPESVTEIKDGAFQEDTVIYVKAGSYAETFIKEYTKTFTGLQYVVE